VGKTELQSMIEDGEVIEVNCHFCNTHYRFSVEELKDLYQKAKIYQAEYTRHIDRIARKLK